LESATGRARKRRRRIASRRRSTKPIEKEEEVALSYPKGKPWRVLWPHPHEDPTPRTATRKIPRLQDFQKAWAQYKATWEDGLSGVPKEKTPSTTDEIHTYNDVGDNASRNLDVARVEAKQLLEQAKERSGIRSQEDLRNFASNMMQLATDCLKEFMTGYRKGRDEEVDKMLNEYFQSIEQDDENEAPKRRRRKPKRAVLRV
jgi:hypothetical protein